MIESCVDVDGMNDSWNLQPDSNFGLGTFAFLCIC